MYPMNISMRHVPITVWMTGISVVRDRCTKLHQLEVICMVWEICSRRSSLHVLSLSPRVLATIARCGSTVIIIITLAAGSLALSTFTLSLMSSLVSRCLSFLLETKLDCRLKNWQHHYGYANFAALFSLPLHQNVPLRMVRFSLLLSFTWNMRSNWNSKLWKL